MYETAMAVKSFLIDYLMENKDDLKDAYLQCNSEDKPFEMQDSILWRRVRTLFTTIAMLLNYEPDTSSGDRLMYDVYDDTKLDDIIDIDDFDLFIWSDMC